MKKVYVVELTYRQFVSVEADDTVDAVRRVEAMDDIPLPEVYEVTSIVKDG